MCCAEEVKNGTLKYSILQNESKYKFMVMLSLRRRRPFLVPKVRLEYLNAPPASEVLQIMLSGVGAAF